MGNFCGFHFLDGRLDPRSVAGAKRGAITKGMVEVKICDICKQSAETLAPLERAFWYGEVKEVCPDCEKVILYARAKIRSILEHYEKEETKTFIHRLIEKMLRRPK